MKTNQSTTASAAKTSEMSGTAYAFRKLEMYSGAVGKKHLATVKAEHAALVAVAKEAKLIQIHVGGIADLSERHELRAHWMTLTNALLNLAAIREGKVVVS